MAWIRDRIDSDAPDDTHIVVGIDYSELAEIGERVVSRLLNSSMDGDEGVFYVLPYDLCYEVTRSAGVVTVDLLTPLTTLTAKGTLEAADWERAKAAGLIPQHARQRDAVGAAPNDDALLEWVTVLSATIPNVRAMKPCRSIRSKKCHRIRTPRRPSNMSALRR